jgi:hypothetical protein
VDSEPTFHFDTELDADPAFSCRSESGPSDNSIDLKKNNKKKNNFLTQNG